MWLVALYRTELTQKPIQATHKSRQDELERRKESYGQGGHDGRVDRVELHCMVTNFALVVWLLLAHAKSRCHGENGG
jgi:hypothetical protein